MKLSELLDQLVLSFQQHKVQGLNIESTESLIIKLLTSELSIPDKILKKLLKLSKNLKKV